MSTKLKVPDLCPHGHWNPHEVLNPNDPPTLRDRCAGGGMRNASVADVLDWLIAKGGETWITKPTGPDGSHELCYAAEPGRYLVFPIPVESAEAKETP